MIYKMHSKILWSGLGAALLGVTLAGCGSNTGDTTTAQAPSAQTETPQTGNAPTDAGAKAGDDHDAEIEATISKYFPGATLVKKPFPFNDTAAAHLSGAAGVKFTGDEGEWQVYEATKEGQRVGLAMMTHSALPDGKDMHIAFAVNPEFAISYVTALDAPNNAQMQTFTKQLVGKNHDAAFKVGKDIKVTPGVSPQLGQIVAHAVHKGVVILEENFNPSHSAHEHSDSTPHKEGDGHNH